MAFTISSFASSCAAPSPPPPSITLTENTAAGITLHATYDKGKVILDVTYNQLEGPTKSIHTFYYKWGYSMDDYGNFNFSDEYNSFIPYTSDPNLIERLNGYRYQIALNQLHLWNKVTDHQLTNQVVYMFVYVRVSSYSSNTKKLVVPFQY